MEHHLARISLANLFLDTFPYNAHTSAIDTLWAGVPIVTRSGRSFCQPTGW
jgi:predicted O-linked N-acetylglucosamine transferase (SPINDLY family)